MGYAARATVAAVAPLAAAAALAVACASGPLRPPVPPDFPPVSPLGLGPLRVPAENPLTRPRAELGRQLFFDPALSRDSTVSCASCHLPQRAFGDSLPRSIGIRGQLGRRVAPPLINRGYGLIFFWDGRATSLEQAVLLPVQDPRELDFTLPELVDRLNASPHYREMFRLAFGDVVSDELVAFALASYIRTLLSGNSRADQFTGGNRAALSDQERLGRELFLGKARCFFCHTGANFSNERLHNTGVGWGGPDLGRAELTGYQGHRGQFKTPSLRDVARTAPYMHDGSFTSLEAVVDFYDAGGGPNPHLDGDIAPLGLTAGEKAALVAFLGSLTGS